MRVGIREQLAALGLIVVLVALAIVSIPVWLFVHGFVTDVTKQALAQTASLKAAQLSSHLDLLQSTCVAITTRLIIQRALMRIENRTITQFEDLRANAAETLQTALLTSGFIDLLQAQIFPANDTGDPRPFFSQTKETMKSIQLPYNSPDDQPVFLGDTGLGYPPMLYPNLTYPYRDTADETDDPTLATVFPDVPIMRDRAVLLGPLIVNESYALISLTQPVISVENRTHVLGYLTVVAAATSLFRLQLSPEGLGKSGETLIIGPDTAWNRFNSSYQLATKQGNGNKTALETADVRFVLPPLTLEGQDTRHDASIAHGRPFLLEKFPVALEAYSQIIDTVNNASGTLDTTNESGVAVAAGFARAQTELVNWVVIVEQARGEAYQPIHKLRDILVGCVFSTIAAVLIFIFPCAHYSVRPIRRLKSATMAATLPPGFEMNHHDSGSSPDEVSKSPFSDKTGGDYFAPIRKLVRSARRPSKVARHGPRHHIFRIPARVEDKKHFVTDELTELTSTFNEMSDELYVQYTHLEEKVAERTKELEISKKAAETANESKTIFLANISHELKTPLNGILGMCTLCMEEDDPRSMKKSLKTMYESGNLLLRLLEDLLNFSRNQVQTQQMALEEEDFVLEDIGMQITALFSKAAREHKIDFAVNYLGSVPTAEDPDNSHDNKRRLLGESPLVLSEVKDMRLVGDHHRILQIILNLVSNSLKFTPEGGKVKVDMRCLGLAKPDPLQKPSSRPGSKQQSDKQEKQQSSLPSLQRLNSMVSSNGRSSHDGGPRSGASLRRKVLDKVDKGNNVPMVEIHTVMNNRGGSSDADSMTDSSIRSATTEAKPCLFEFVVEDTGLGIPENLQDKVFEPFVQGDPGLSRKFGGAGLGLPICKQLAALMGGSISLTSTVGRGTTVFLHIPLRLASIQGLRSADVSQVNVRSGLSTELGDHQEGAKNVHVTDRPGSSGATTAISTNLPTPLLLTHPMPSAMTPTAPADNIPILAAQPSPAVLESNPHLANISPPATQLNGPTSPAPRSDVNAEETVPPSPAATTPIATPFLDLAATTSAATLERIRSNASKATTPGYQARVLVADDNRVNVEVVTKMLKLEKVTNVSIARDGQEAFELVKMHFEHNQQFDLIFMDIQMPRLDGLESTLRIREMGYSAPIVALTASAESDIVERGMEVGIDSFMSKPIRRPALKKVLSDYSVIVEPVK